MWQTNLIKLYCAVCDNSSTIEAVKQRQSNNFRPQFSAEECIAVYLWDISRRRFEQKTIYNYTKNNHLLDCFPKLPSYAAFSRRLNALAPAFQALAELWLNSVADGACEEAAYIVDEQLHRLKSLDNLTRWSLDNSREKKALLWTLVAFVLQYQFIVALVVSSLNIAAQFLNYQYGLDP